MFVHARTFDTRWGQALAYLNNDEEYESEVLCLRVWAPLCDDGSLALVEIKLGLKSGSEAALDLMEEANRSALENMNASKFEDGMQKAVGTLLDDAFAKHLQ